MGRGYPVRLQPFIYPQADALPLGRYAYRPMERRRHPVVGGVIRYEIMYGRMVSPVVKCAPVYTMMGVLDRPIGRSLNRHSDFACIIDRGTAHISIHSRGIGLLTS